MTEDFNLSEKILENAFVNNDRLLNIEDVKEFITLIKEHIETRIALLDEFNGLMEAKLQKSELLVIKSLLNKYAGDKLNGN